jgi:hypothetical protein
MKTVVSLCEGLLSAAESTLNIAVCHKLSLGGLHWGKKESSALIGWTSEAQGELPQR